VLQTAWKIDEYDDYQRVRTDIAAVKVAMPKVLHDVAARALQIHGALGTSEEMPFGAMVMEALTMGLVDGPTEVHKVTLARQVLRDHKPSDDLFPTGHLPKLRAAARERFADVLAEIG
jgi:acyl-CoA dehydrogenase